MHHLKQWSFLFSVRTLVIASPATPATPAVFHVPLLKFGASSHGISSLLHHQHPAFLRFADPLPGVTYLANIPKASPARHHSELFPPKHALRSTPTLGSALRAARATSSGATPAPTTGSSSPTPSHRSGAPSSHESRDHDPIVRMSTLLKKPLPVSRAPTAEEFYKDESVWVSTPVRASTAHGYSERLDYASHYSEELCRLLRTYGYKAASGLSLDGEDAETDFTVLLANLAHVLSPISHFEFDEYHMALNELIFVILPTVLRGTALALQEESARVYPHDGRAALQRLRFHVEGIGDPDSNRYWTKLRALIIDESNDPAPQLTVFRKLADKHAKLHSAYNDVNRVEDLRHVLKQSAAVSPHVTPLYLVVLRELTAGARFTFSSLSLRICTVHRDEGGLARLTTPPPPTSGGGYGVRTVVPWITVVKKN
ncbi:hypothetical protein CYMTET_52814 [Cymbomonas tetramitiformis]|uniref:Uncharacterized protein n=1 Tax=Cymbomonas tetramitiformis TaxID=36881 RepID=A0AAE0BI84_9CHLO|nr:hypothetical protein CYMTET_52814 [Cymbomonas tetramitiformis]